MGTVVDNSPFILYTDISKILFKFSFDMWMFSWPDFIICHVEYILSLSYYDFREGNCLSHQKSGKTWNFMYKTYGELSTTCHHFEYRPLEIAIFQRAVTSLIFAEKILFKLHTGYVLNICILYNKSVNLTLSFMWVWTGLSL